MANYSCTFQEWSGQFNVPTLPQLFLNEQSFLGPKKSSIIILTRKGSSGILWNINKWSALRKETSVAMGGEESERETDES